MSVSSTKDDAVPAFKSFVTEDELEEKRKKRQEEWEKVRKPDDPIEAPEEEYDPRSLFDQLQEQKMKKQEEIEEQLRLRNQVKGLEKDEVEFLDYVSQRQQEVDAERSKQDSAVINEYKEAVANQVIDHTKVVETKTLRSTSSVHSSRKSQQALLAGAVKRKSTENNDDTKKRKHSEEEKQQTFNPDSTTGGDQSKESKPGKGDEKVPASSNSVPLQVVGILPGIGEYTDSSESNSSSEESEIDLDGFGMNARLAKHIHGLGCSHQH